MKKLTLTTIPFSTKLFATGATTAGTSILPATAGAWCTLKYNGENWVVIAKG